MQVDQRCVADSSGSQTGARKRNDGKRLRPASYATRRLEQSEKARCEAEDRLSSALNKLDASQEARQKLKDELATRNDELEDLRARVKCARDFRRHVELTRQLKEERQLNEHLQRQLVDRRGGVAILKADGSIVRLTNRLQDDWPPLAAYSTHAVI